MNTTIAALAAHHAAVSGHTSFDVAVVRAFAALLVLAVAVSIVRALRRRASMVAEARVGVAEYQAYQAAQRGYEEQDYTRN